MKSKNKVLFAGYEIGGQMQLLAKNMTSLGIDAKSIAFNKSENGFNNGPGIYNERGVFIQQLKRIFYAARAFLVFDTFHFFWGVSLVSIWRYHLIDLPILKLLGKTVVIHFRGSDIVSGDFHNEIHKHQNDGKCLMPYSSERQMKSIHYWLKYSDIILVSEPKLLFVSERAIVSPQVVDIDFWKSIKPPMSKTDGVFRVVHAPTNRYKKGTEEIITIISELKNSGYSIELILAEGQNQESVRDLYEMADIGIDQLYYGWHGKVSVELMAMCRPVICKIDENLLGFRNDLPIINSNIRDLKSVIISIMNKEIDIEGKSNFGRAYVEKYHCSKVEAKRLFELY